MVTGMLSLKANAFFLFLFSLVFVFATVTLHGQDNAAVLKKKKEKKEKTALCISVPFQHSGHSFPLSPPPISQAFPGGFCVNLRR